MEKNVDYIQSIIAHVLNLENTKKKEYHFTGNWIRAPPSKPFFSLIPMYLWNTLQKNL